LSVPDVRRGAAHRLVPAALAGGLAAHFYGRPAFRAAIWPGPLFFPYALDDVFWPSAYDEVFWTYGTDDIIVGIIEPQLYAPDMGGAPRHRYGTRRGGHDARASVPPPEAPANAQPCGERGELSGLAGIEAELGLTAEQRAPFNDLKAAEASAAEILVSACPAQVPTGPIGRLDAMAQGFNAMLRAVRTVRPPLERFYGALNDEQKARLLGAGSERRDAASRWLARCRSGPRGVASLPMDGITRELRLDSAQLAALDDLARASDEAANAVRGSCPADIPLTPTGRLAAIDARLSALLRALETMRPALDHFYAKLSDEQKARFDRIGERPRRRAG